MINAWNVTSVPAFHQKYRAIEGDFEDVCKIIKVDAGFYLRVDYTVTFPYATTPTFLQGLLLVKSLQNGLSMKLQPST